MIELMVLVFTALITFVVVGLSVLVLWVEIESGGDADTEGIIQTILTLSSAILGALLGLFAGRSGNAVLHERPDDTHDDIPPPS